MAYLRKGKRGSHETQHEVKQHGNSCCVDVDHDEGITHQDQFKEVSVQSLRVAKLRVYVVGEVANSAQQEDKSGLDPEGAVEVRVWLD